MGAIEERLEGHRVLGLDTSVFIYHFEAREKYLPLTRELFRGIEAGRWAGVLSVVSLMECTVLPWRLGRADLARQYETLLIHFPNLTLMNVTREVARRAAQLRAWYNLRPPDALLVGTSLVAGATVFVTNDRSLRGLNDLLDVVLLDEVV